MTQRIDIDNSNGETILLYDLVPEDLINFSNEFKSEGFTGFDLEAISKIQSHR